LGTSHATSDARADAATAFDDRIVGDASRLNQTARNENIFFFVVFSQWFQTPQSAGGQDDIFCISAIDVEANFVQLFTVVGLAVSTRLTLSAPEHFFGSDSFSAFEGLVGPLVTCVLSRLHDYTGKLVPEDGWKTRQARIVNVTIFVRLRHVDV
jgi:hypothetical protein